jgi:hypothetical protein
MATDLAIGLIDRPGTLAQASETLGRAGVAIEGTCGFVCDGQGVFHVLVQDAVRARRALIDSGFEIQDERQVVLARLEERPGAAAELLHRVAAAGVNVDLLYAAADGRLVFGGSDVSGLRRALAG